MPDTAIKRKSVDAILETFYPSCAGCGGRTCQYQYVGGQWVPGANKCGGSCDCPPAPQNIVELLSLEGYPVADGTYITFNCCGPGGHSAEPAIAAHIKLLKSSKLLSKVTIALAVLSLILG